MYSFCLNSKEKGYKMKKSNKGLIIALIICLVILIGAGGTFAYIYVATDLLKSNQELFFKYFSQVIDEENSFFDKNIENYFDKKEQSPYENTGSIRVNFQAPEESLSDNLVESVNKFNIRFSGKTDNTRKNAEQNIELDFGQDMIIPINYRRNSQLYGLQSKYIGSKYIALENSNLKELVEKLGMDSSEIPDKIELEQSATTLEFTQEEKNQIKETYQQVLIEQIAKDKFTKAETQTGTKFTVTLSAEEVKNLFTQLLETFKQDTMLMNKLNQFLSTVESTSQFDQEMIQNLIDEVNQSEVSEFQELKMTIGEQNKLLNQILIEYGAMKVEIVKNISNDSVNYVIGIQSNVDEGQVEMSLSCTFSGIFTQENVNETYEFKIGGTVDGETVSYDYIINNQVQFKDSVSIESLNNDTALFLNDCDEATLQSLMTAIAERIVSLNSQITSNLGVEESENPLLYSNPLTSLSMIIYDSTNDILSKAEEAQEAIKQQEMEEQKKVEENIDKTYSILKQAHNDTFERYLGQRRGAEVNALISTTLSSNLSETDENRKVSITLDGTEILGINDTEAQRVDTAKQYQVEMSYDDSTGLITEIKVTTIN